MGVVVVVIIRVILFGVKSYNDIVKNVILKHNYVCEF